MTPNEAIQELKTVQYCNHRLTKINEDIIVLRHQMTGMARSGPELTPQQAKSPLPMPHYRLDPYCGPAPLIEAVDAKEKEAQYYRLRILYTDRWFKKMKTEDQQILVELYLLQRPYKDTAEDHGYTKKGLWKHLRAAFAAVGIEE